MLPSCAIGTSGGPDGEILREDTVPPPIHGELVVGEPCAREEEEAPRDAPPRDLEARCRVGWSRAYSARRTSPGTGGPGEALPMPVYFNVRSSVKDRRVSTCRQSFGVRTEARASSYGGSRLETEAR